MGRRPIARGPSLSRSLALGGGLAPLDVLDLFSGGTFTRSTEGSYLTSAPTNGDTAFLAWASANARRIENRGDGLGDMLLMEGGRTNLLLRSQEFDAAAWSLAGTTPTVTANARAAPDGTTTAERIAAPLTGRAFQSPTVANTTRHSGSLFLRDPVATAAAWQILLAQSTVSAINGTLANAWARADHSRVSETTSEGLFLVDARDWSGNGGIVAAARDVHAWGAQLEAGAFPSSYIRTTTPALARGADVLSYAVGEYPSSFLTRGFRFTWAPDFASTEAPNPSFNSLIGFNGGNILHWLTSGEVRLYTQAADTRITTAALTFARNALITITVEPNAGRITVSGAATGNGVHTGTACTIDSGLPMRVGVATDGSNPNFGRFGRYIEAL